MICSRCTEIGTSMPCRARNGLVHTPVATTTVSAEIVDPSARRTPVTRSPSTTSSLTAVPWRILIPVERAAAANAWAV